MYIATLQLMSNGNQFSYPAITLPFSGRNTSFRKYMAYPHRREVDTRLLCSGKAEVALIRSITTSPVVEHPDSEKSR